MRSPTLSKHSNLDLMTKQGSSRALGVGQVLIAAYAIMALAATARSAVQLATRFEQAPLAYLLSALAAAVYIVATVALFGAGSRWYAVAWGTITFELLGVITVGIVSLAVPALFPADTVWSNFGSGYVFLPLALPVLGMAWLWRRRPQLRVS